MDFGTAPLHTVILKVASRCNLNCSYCYVYNKGDATWKSRPGLMPIAVFDATLERILRHITISGQSEIALTFHGGEPCLLGARTFGEWCARARNALGGTANLRVRLQTNGTLLDEEWMEELRRHDVHVGISIDGPPEIHDQARVDHRGAGTYERVRRGLELLRSSGVPFGVLCVIPLGSDPLHVHRHFMALGASSISYLWPDHTHDTIAPIRDRFGPTPCADFLIPIFDDWWFNGTLETRIAGFWHMSRVILGGRSQTDTLGNDPFGFLVVETDGSIEGLDCLRVCREGIASTGLHVDSADFGEIARASPLHGQVIFRGVRMPTACRVCPEQSTCGGGYLPHRFSARTGFDNPSAWCADLLKVFAHIRGRLEVDPSETTLRRIALRSLSEQPWQEQESDSAPMLVVSPQEAPSQPPHASTVRLKVMPQLSRR